MKKVLVTGAGGFIGSHLVEKLVERGCQVRAFVRYNSSSSWGWLEESGCKNEVEIISGDIRDTDLVRCAVRGVDTVFHLAALIGIPYSYISPEAYVETNIKGSLNVLQASRDFGVKKVIHTSTSEVYGTAEFVPIHEKHRVHPQSPYAASKAGADFLALSFYRSFDFPVTVVRPFNTYGPRQSARAVIPTIITQILSGHKKIRLGALTPTRDLTYVQDTTEGFICAGESSLSAGEVINLGNKKEISIQDLACLIARLMDVDIVLEEDAKRKRPVKSEVDRLLADNAKAGDILKWLPQYKLEEGLLETIEWFKQRDHLEKYKSELYNV
ncbi:MAG: NAD-dependent 4,6-dehydratase LegB [Candidatus Omnitrophica bacterium]|nr:NAD-dependent 4,6-dehydratase LegB [Candidatus Omnitrophota bacterium]MDE2223433.1 NAD-dependent 4,6-dehydratase LegB [Candidatus Omnitrophota bacterium]